MTRNEQTALDKAIERAGRQSVKVLASGRIKSTGQRFWLVSSQSHPERPHIVFLHADTHRLSCDCPAGEHGRVCVHRASVHMHLTVQAARIAALDAQVEAGLREERAAGDADAAEQQRLATAVRTNIRTTLTMQCNANAQHAQWAREARERETAPLLRSPQPISPWR